LIAHVLLRRRDLRSASRWYLAALGRIRRISLYANREGGSDRQRVREQTGAEWQTPAIHKSTEAQIWAYLGDICHATNGIAFLDDITVPPLQEEVEKKLISIVRHLGFPVYEDRVFEYFSTAARHRFQEMGDRDSAMNVLLRQLEFRMRQLRRSVYRLAGDPKPSPAQSIAILFDFLATWRGFWKSSRLALDSQYITPNSLSRDREHFRGRPVDNRLIGNASRLIGEFLRESSLHIATFQEVFQKQDKPGQEIRHWRGITPDQLEKEGARRSKWLKGKFRTNHLKHVKEIASGEASRSGFKHYCAIMGQILNVWHLEQPVGDPFAAGGMLDRRENDLPRKRGLASPLYRVNTGSDRDPAGDGSELVIESVRRKVWDILERSGADEASAGPPGLLLDQLSVLSAAEAAVLHGYLYHRDSMMDFEQAMTTMEACSVYHSALYLVELAFEPGGAFSLAGLPREDLYELQDVLHEVAKRFAVNTVDVLKREREQNRNTYTLLSEAYFGLGEILLFRIRRHLAHEESSKAEPVEPPPKEKLQASAKSDVVLGDLWRQAWSAFRDGLNCILMEIEDLDHRYRLPVEVNHASGNLMDPVLHFRICRSVGQRHASFRTVRMQNSEVEQVISEINSTLSEVMPYDPAKEAWLPALATRVELASRLRTDRPTLEIISPSSQSASGEAGAGAQAPLQICCVALKDFGRQKRSGKPQQRFAYFGPVNPADRSAPAAAPATAADRSVAAS
jgi:hypothetical protein